MKKLIFAAFILLVFGRFGVALADTTDRAIWVENAVDRINRSGNPAYWSGLRIISWHFDGSRPIEETNDRNTINWFRWRAEDAYKTYPSSQPIIEGFERANAVYETVEDPTLQKATGVTLRYLLRKVTSAPDQQVTRWQDYNQTFFDTYASTDYDKREILGLIYDNAQKDPKFAKLFNEAYYSLIRAKTDAKAAKILDENRDLASFEMIRNFVRGTGTMEQRILALQEAVNTKLKSLADESKQSPTQPAQQDQETESDPLAEFIKQQVDAKTAAQADFENRGMHSAVAIASRFMDPKTASQFSAIGHAIVDVHALRGEFNRLYSDGKTATNLATAAAAFNYIAIFFSVVDAFSEKGPTPEQIILEQIQALAKQMQAFQEENRQRFDRIDSRLSAIFAAMNAQYQDLSNKLSTVSFDVNTVRGAMAETLLRLNQIETSLTNLLRLTADQPFYREMKGCIGYRDRTGRVMSAKEYDACVDSIRAFIDDAKSPALSGDKSNGSGPGAFAQVVKPDDVPAQVNFFISLVQERGGYPALPRVANPIRWAQAANYYSILAVENEDIFVSTPANSLDEILGEGERIDRTLSRDIPLDKAKFATAIDSLLKDYVSQASEVEAAAAAFAQRAIAETALTTWLTPEELTSKLGQKFKELSQRDISSAPPWPVIDANVPNPNPYDFWKTYGPKAKGAGFEFKPLSSREYIWQQVFTDPSVPALELLGLGTIHLWYYADVDQGKYAGDYGVVWGKPFITVFIYLLPNGASVPGNPLAMLPYRAMPYTLVFTDLCEGHIGVLSCGYMRSIGGRERQFDWEGFLAAETSLARHKVVASPTIAPLVEYRLNELLLKQHAALLREFNNVDSDLYRAVSALDASVNALRGLLALAAPNLSARNDQLRASIFGAPDLERCAFVGSRVLREPLAELASSTTIQLDPAKLGTLEAPPKADIEDEKSAPAACDDNKTEPPASFLPLLDRKGIEALLAAGTRENGQPDVRLLNPNTMLAAVSHYASESAANFRTAIAASLNDIDYETNRHSSLWAEIAKLRALKHIRAD